MKKALGKKELLVIVPLSMSSIDRLEHKGQFPKRFYITDGRCAWDGDEIEQWLDERKANNPKEFGGTKPDVTKRKYRPVSNTA
ncbi:TPA: helix-turn-helix transcriptional regulator [Klebsiella michiganensis]|uniref:helix-turn-helix transcriptional regulator n=1 Tax=Klebsiella TaxID=570 RepID=UPI000C7B13B6|nr:MULTISPECIES: AlpA family phage regulatory protein [Klebsiella]ELO7626083.1 AlpA family phage regulatory protein [Klebsiella michiganensis]MBT1552547.1 AlpA family phage regulatory protein [Klebsiella pneumoniae]MBT1663979.1 AlpA family phage regulatory protein [Klebsiella pneumoniae]MCP5736389.1 AlpA family phage regulatory protein [Klebsiella pneumoniae]PLJ55726.1 transcriptional regulator [Klebsiella quasipneumoniae]